MATRTEQFPAEDSKAPQAPRDVAWLRAARERSGVTLDDITRATKIRPAQLAALEAGAVDQLPPTFFTRGFVRAYAKAIGLDPEDTANRYLEDIGFVAAADGENVAAIVETAVGRTGVIGFDQHHAPLIQSLHPDRSSRLVVAAAVVGAIIYVGPSNWNALASSVGPAPIAGTAVTAAVATPAPVEAAPAPAPVPPVEAAAPPAAPAGGPLQFQITPQAECWFSAAADGNASQSGLLKAGDQRAIEVRDALVLRVGDPAACTFSIDGHAGRVPAAPGVPVTVRITKDNYKDFFGS